MVSTNLPPLWLLHLNPDTMEVNYKLLTGKTVPSLNIIPLFWVRALEVFSFPTMLLEAKYVTSQ